MRKGRSATWSTDECLSVTRDSDRVTGQHCLIAEALASHRLGSIIASYRGGISFLHSLYASNRARNPRPGSYLTEPGHADDPGPRIDFSQNTIFKWSTGPGYTGRDHAEKPERIAMNYAGNYLQPGADTGAPYRAKAFTICRGATVEMFPDGNQVENPPQPINVPSELLMVKPGCTLILHDTPAPFETLAARAAYLRVLENVGATKPKRDAGDARIIAAP